MIAAVLLLASGGQRTGTTPTGQHPARCKIIDLVCENLGINETQLRNETGLRRSVVRHHLAFLMDSGILRKFPVGRENHYFPAGTGPQRMQQMAAANHGRAREVLRQILLDPGLSQSELGEEVGMTRKVLRYYLDLLAQNGLLVERRDARNLRYWPGESMDASVHDRVLRNRFLDAVEDERDLRKPRPPHDDLSKRLHLGR